MKLIDRKLAIEQLGDKVDIRSKNLYVSRSLYKAFKKACRPYTVSEMLVNLENQAYTNLSMNGSIFALENIHRVKDRSKLSYSCTDEHEQFVLEICQIKGIKPYIFRELIMSQFLRQFKDES